MPPLQARFGCGTHPIRDGGIGMPFMELIRGVVLGIPVLIAWLLLSKLAVAMVDRAMVVIHKHKIL